MSKSSIKIEKLGKEYVLSLLEQLEERKSKREIDSELYDTLKEKYQSALESAEDKCHLRDGFIEYEAITPNLESIKDSVKNLEKRIKNIDSEKKNIESRFDKLEKLLAEGNVSETAVVRKRREYEVLIAKIEEERRKLVEEIPNSLMIIQQLDEILKQNIEDIDVESALDSRSKTALEKERKRLETIHKETLSAAKNLSKLADIPFSPNGWKQAPVPKTTKIEKAAIKKPTQPKEPVRATQAPSRPPPGEDYSITWKGIQIGKLIGDISIVGSQFGIIGTDRPSLAMIRDIALTGPSRLRSSSNPKEIEERIKQLIMDNYGIAERAALYPENMVRFCIDNNIGIDLLKLINSYYASVSLSSISYPNNNQPVISNNAQVLTLAENSGLLGRRILAPDRNLVGVVHELYLDPRSLQLYMLAFKGVPPPIIRKIYRDTHNRNLSEGNFSNFRNEISKKLSIPIYEALTPSSMLRYSLMSGQIGNLNQLVTLVESMNPRISKTTDITSISTQGVLLTRFPQNALPRINYLQY